jgi:hypothetical protein
MPTKDLTDSTRGGGAAACTSTLTMPGVCLLRMKLLELTQDFVAATVAPPQAAAPHLFIRGARESHATFSARNSATVGAANLAPKTTISPPALLTVTQFTADLFRPLFVVCATSFRRRDESFPKALTLNFAVVTLLTQFANLTTHYLTKSS